jgi:diaminopimelate decarboxylase
MQIILNVALNFPNLEFIDIGGGIGVPYRPDEHDFNFKAFGKHIEEMMREFTVKYGYSPYLAIEPGRFPVAESGTLLCTVLDIKNTPLYKFAGVDSGFNHLLRPMAYGSYHPVINASRVEGTKKEIVVSGYLCENGDVFTRSEEGIKPQQITDPEIGDILAILNTGAYGYSMSSNYNSRPRPAEVLITNGEAALIRKRETFDDLIKTQV